MLIVKTVNKHKGNKQNNDHKDNVTPFIIKVQRPAKAIAFFQ